MRRVIDMPAHAAFAPAAARGLRGGIGVGAQRSMTPQLAVISWNTLLVYLPVKTSEDLTYEASLRLPAGWKYATSLTTASTDGSLVRFAPMTMSLLPAWPQAAGERPGDLPSEEGGKAAVHINERFSGRFRRVISLSEDIDPNGVSATYRDGILHITVAKRESSRPRQITVN